MSLFWGVGGAYVQDKNTSAKLCTKNAEGLMREGSVFVGHYGKCNVVVVKQWEGVKVWNSFFLLLKASLLSAL